MEIMNRRLRKPEKSYGKRHGARGLGRLAPRVVFLAWATLLLSSTTGNRTGITPANGVISDHDASYSSAQRSIASLAFPQIASTGDIDDILENYPEYLRFVLDVGKQTDRQTAVKLHHTFQNLRRRYPDAAARFLKGLRFELIQKVELMNIAPRSLNTNHPEMRRWITKYIKEWYREADEYLFRAIAVK